MAHPSQFLRDYLDFRVLDKFSNYDDDGYPHFEEVEKLPELKPNEQQILMKKAIIQYFIDEELL